MGREGFTLIEILMVLMILTVGVLPIAIIQHQARKEVNESDRFTQGIELAQFHMERAKGIVLETAPERMPLVCFMNMRKAPFNDVRIRKRSGENWIAVTYKKNNARMRCNSDRNNFYK